MRSQIIRAMAMTEALIDFSEGDDIEEGVLEHGQMQFYPIKYLSYAHYFVQPGR